MGLTGVVPTSRWCGDQRSDHRRVINEVLYRVRMGRQWSDLPERFGLWKTAYKRRIPKASGSTLLCLFPAGAAVEGPVGGSNSRCGLQRVSNRQSPRPVQIQSQSRLSPRDPRTAQVRADSTVRYVHTVGTRRRPGAPRPPGHAPLRAQ
ncbi:transposase [Streptomyces sp. NPDC058471]|uniref:transposase n=1 Tax=Streptomyces sp. NPDC058471 TaxID=3346516 RepID=UPI003669FEAC